jgi:mRNA interferase RelE/StbE
VLNTINWTPKAAKRLRKLDRQHQVAIRDGVNTLETMPDCQNVKSLMNHEHGYRLRVGDYRILFNWDGAIRIVDIEDIRKRDERTY